MYEGIVQDLIDELGRLPGIGPKSAQRIAFHILAAEPADVLRLANVMREVKEKVRFIPVGTLSEVLKHALVRPGRTPARAVRGVPQATSLIANDKPAEGHKEPAAVM